MATEYDIWVNTLACGQMLYRHLEHIAVPHDKIDEVWRSEIARTYNSLQQWSTKRDSLFVLESKEDIDASCILRNEENFVKIRIFARIHEPGEDCEGEG